MPILLKLQRSVVSRMLAKFILKVVRWRTEVIPPPASSYVMIGAPHTSNWDFLLALCFMTAEDIPIRLLGKDSLFHGPMGLIMRGIGAIPVNRTEKTRLVDQVAAKFDEYEDLVIGVSPEGTRSNSSYWRTGFYYIALKARVPVAMAYIDYKRRVCGLGPSFMPTGDIRADFQIIKNFYAGVVGKFPYKQGEIKLAEI